jgi:hypothetical protein
VEEVGVGRERAFAALVLWHRDLVLLGEFDQRRAAVQIPFAPGGDDLDVRIERIIAELEADLVIALAGGAVGDGVGADLMRDFDLPLGDQRPGDRRAEQVKPLVERVGAHHREDVVGDELVLEVVDEDMLWPDPHQLGLGPSRLQLLALAEIGGEGDDLAIVGLPQPFEDDAGVEAAGKGKHDAANGFAHRSPFTPGKRRRRLATTETAIQARYRFTVLARSSLLTSGRSQ